MRKRILLYLLLFLAIPVLPVKAQQRLKFEVAEFRKDAFDLTARKIGKTDSNGEVYAIVKLTTDIENDDLRQFHFDFGNMNSIEELHDDLNELWVYVQRNAKRVTISRDGYIAVKYNLPETVEAGSTYVMKLIVHTPKVESRVLQFKVNPANEGALVKVKREDAEGDYDLWGSVDASGSIDQLKEVGVYLYEVTAENYETSEGRIILTAGSENYVESVTLKPNFGWLEIQDTYGISGAKIYVDNKMIGTVPYKSNERWEARDGYKLMISAGELYKTYYETFSIRKGEVTKLDPQLESNFAKTTLQVDGDKEADIYVNNTRRGTGTWSGPLKAGTYTIECRHVNHQTTTRQIVVKPDQEETFMLQAPIPITGTVYVTTQPAGARVYLDGSEKGVSPVNLKDVIIGQHRIKVLLDNYKTEEQQVEVKENSTTKSSFELRDYAKFTVSSTPKEAVLYMDGEYIGETPGSFEGASGMYDIRVTKKGYRPYHSKVRLNSSHPTLNVTLHKQYQKPTCGYFQLGMQVGHLAGVTGTLGMYIKNFNVEGTFLYGGKPFCRGVDVFWNSTGHSGSRPLHSVYQPLMAYGGKIGYGIILGTLVRLTPQVGAFVLNVDDKMENSSAYVITTNVSLRADVSLVSCVGLFVSPEYAIPVAKSSVYKSISAVSSDIKGWSSGFNFRFGISISL